MYYIFNIHETIIPWIIKTSKVIFEVSEHSKIKTHPSSIYDKFHNILEHHTKQLFIFTDSPKENDKTAYVAILNKKNWKNFYSKGKFHFFNRTLCYISCARRHLWKQPQKFNNILRLALCFNITEKTTKNKTITPKQSPPQKTPKNSEDPLIIRPTESIRLHIQFSRDFYMLNTKLF